MWTVTDKESGTKLRWHGVPAKCNEEVPEPFRYGGGAEEDGQPPAKRARTVSSGGGAASVTGDPFEDMKLCMWAAVSAKGEKGVSSGQLGYEFGCDRKAVTASLYACQKEGKVQNTADEGKPRWIAIMEPP